MSGLKLRPATLLRSARRAQKRVRVEPLTAGCDKLANISGFLECVDETAGFGVYLDVLLPQCERHTVIRTGCRVALRQMVRRLPRSEYRIARPWPPGACSDDGRTDSDRARNRTHGAASPGRHD